MSRPRGGLGRGLGALIPTAPNVAAQADGTPDALADAPNAQGVAGPQHGGGVEGRHDRPSDMFFERTEPPADTTATSHTPDADVTTPVAIEEDASPTQAATAGGQGPPSALGEHAPDGAVQGSVGPSHTAAPARSAGAVLHELPIASIRANARQPRAAFDDEALAELSHSIGEFGVLQPVVVRSSADGYELVMGERRLRAAAAAGLSTIPAIVRETGDDAMLRDALLENIHRAQLNPLEEAAAYQQLLEEFGVTHEELAQRLGRSRSLVSNTVRLMNLSVAVQRRVAAGVLSAGHARALLGLDDVAAQDDLAARIVAEGLSVRATEELVSLANRGGVTRPVRRRPVRTYPTPAVADLADKLSDVFDTRVRVDIGQRKGKITVEFATVADLDRIVTVMAPQLALANARTADSGPNHDASGMDDGAATASATETY